MSGSVNILDHRLDMNFTIQPYIQRAARVGRDPRKRRDGQGTAAWGKQGVPPYPPGAHDTVSR